METYFKWEKVRPNLQLKWSVDIHSKAIGIIIVNWSKISLTPWVIPRINPVENILKKLYYTILYFLKKYSEIFVFILQNK